MQNQYRIACRILVVFLLIISTALIVSCSTIPLPDGPNQSLVIIPVRLISSWVDKNGNVLSLDSITLTIREMNYETSPEDLRQYKASASSRDLYAAVALPKGLYLIDSVKVAYHSDRGWDDTHTQTVSYQIYVESDSVQLIPQILNLEKNDYHWYSLRFRGYPDADQKEAILAALKEEQFWPAWSGCQLVRF